MSWNGCELTTVTCTAPGDAPSSSSRLAAPSAAHSPANPDPRTSTREATTDSSSRPVDRATRAGGPPIVRVVISKIDHPGRTRAPHAAAVRGQRRPTVCACGTRSPRVRIPAPSSSRCGCQSSASPTSTKPTTTTTRTPTATPPPTTPPPTKTTPKPGIRWLAVLTLLSRLLGSLGGSR
jgi:hypothetical protein